MNRRLASHEGIGAGASQAGAQPSLAMLRGLLLIVGLLLPLNLPFSIPPVGSGKFFGWSAGFASTQERDRIVVTHTTREARAAGLRPGDVVIQIGGERASSATLERIRAQAAVGDTLVLRVQRAQSTLSVAVPVSANLASYAGYIGYRLLVLLAAWLIGMALLITRNRQPDAVIVAAALILIAPSAFPNGVPAEGLVLLGAQTAWQLLGTAQRILFPALLCHFLVLHMRGPEVLRSARVWGPVYGIAFALVLAVTNGLTDPLARSQDGWQRDLRLASGGVFDVAALVAAAALWWQLKDRATPVRWLAFAIGVYAAASLGYLSLLHLEPVGPDPELMRRARSLVLGLVPATAALHFYADRREYGAVGERRRLASSAAVLLTVLYASAVAGVAAVVLSATQTSVNGIEWLLFLAIFLAAILFSPVLRWARELVDRRAYAPWAEAEAQARAFVDRLCAELDPERITTRTTQELPVLLEVEWCNLLLDEELTRSWDLTASEDVTSAPPALLRDLLVNGSRNHASHTVPIRRPDGDLMGVLVLGPRLAVASADPPPHVIARTVGRGLASALRTAETYVELRRTQNELAEAERITAMGALAGGLAHEIKNPLASLKMGLHLLERDGVDVNRLRRIQSDLRRIDDLVSSLLHYTHDGEAEQAEVLDLRHLAHSCVDDLRSLASSRGVSIIERYPPENAAAVGSPGRLRLVVSNLLRNALDAVPENGRIEIGIRLEDSYLELMLRDSGNGIPAADREHVFKLGYSTKPGGTGLGLALARREIDRLNGRIEVLAGDDRGTTLRVVLPRPIYSA